MIQLLIQFILLFMNPVKFLNNKVIVGVPPQDRPTVPDDWHWGRTDRTDTSVDS